jgi:hypothetical protein
VWFLARHLIMRYVRLDRVLLGLHRKIRSCADSGGGQRSRQYPAAREPALTAPAAADKQEQSAHGSTDISRHPCPHSKPPSAMWDAKLGEFGP